MSQTRPSLEPLLLVLVDDVDVDEPSAAGPLEDDSSVDVSDIAGAVETLAWVMLPKLDTPGPPPQAVRLPIRARARGARMGGSILAKKIVGVLASASSVHREDDGAPSIGSPPPEFLK